MLNSDILHRDFKPQPYWWEAYRPQADELIELPREVRVAIVGAGYAGLSTALELAKHGIDAVVLEAAELGYGASTRNGGTVSGGVNIGKGFTGKSAAINGERAARLLSDASDAFALIDRLIAEEGIECHWEKPGRFVGAWTRHHFETQRQRLSLLNMAAQSGAYMVPRDEQRAEMLRAITIMAAWWSNAPANCIRRFITKACSRPAGGAVSQSVPRLRLSGSSGSAAAGASKPGAGW